LNIKLDLAIKTIWLLRPFVVGPRGSLISRTSL